MKKLFFLASTFWLIFVSVPVLAHNLADCEKFLKENKIVNSNAIIPVGDYDRPHSRAMSGYIRFLGPEFQNHLTTLDKSNVWIDSGGGYGLAVLEAVVSIGVKGYVINIQDFWQHFLAGGQVMGGNLDKMAEICNPSGSRYLFGSRNGVGKCVKKLMKGGAYNYLPGFTEQRLPDIADRADLITDLYGAFFYSSDRSRILDLYYGKLQPKGAAYVRYKTQNEFTLNQVEKGYGVEDVIVGTRMYFIDFLLKTYPNVFSLSRELPGVLIVRRDPLINELNLAKILQVGSLRMQNTSGMNYPVVKWRWIH